MSNATQQDHLAHLRADAAAVLDRARAVAASVSGPELLWAPPDGGWSVGQVFEHLLLADGSYLVKMRPLVNEPRARSTWSPDRTWHPSLAGRLLAWSLRSPRKLPAPRVYQPPPVPRARVIDAYLAQQQEVLSLIDAAGRADLQGSRVVSPVSPLIRLNLGDCFTIVVVHSQRHIAQAERVAARARAEAA